MDLYVQAFTPCADVPMKFVGLMGLPDLKRHGELTRFGIKTSDISIVDRLYICKNSIFQTRQTQWRLGMHNLYRISDDEADEHLSFIGINCTLGSYINEEHLYLSFKLVIVMVSRFYFSVDVALPSNLHDNNFYDTSILTRHCAQRNAPSTNSLQ